MNDKYITIGQLADYLQISRWTLYRYVKSLGIPHIRVGRHIRFDPVVIDNWLGKVKQIPLKTKINGGENDE